VKLREHVANAGPSLADILLKGAKVQPSVPSYNVTDPPEVDFAPLELMDVDEFPEPEPFVEESLPIDPVDIHRDQSGIGNESHDLLRLVEEDRLLSAGLPDMRTKVLNPNRPGDVIDLTRETDIFARPPPTPVADRSGGVAKDMSSPSPEINVSIPTKGPARSKVKFDDRLQFKSVSSERGKEIESFPPRRLSANGGNDRRNAKTRAKIRQLQEQITHGEEGRTKAQQHRWSKEPGMSDIINVLDSLHNAIIDNIANKSLEVRSDIRAARDALLDDAASDLFCLREESVAHLNNLFAVETEYANFSRSLSNGYEGALTTNRNICELVRQTIGGHDRDSISKKMPRSVFKSRLPQSFVKWAQ